MKSRESARAAGRRGTPLRLQPFPVLVRTAVAPLEMTAEGRRSAQLDRGHDTPLGRGERRTIVPSIGFTIAAEDVRHFQLWAIHGAQRLEERWRSGLDFQVNRVR
jgi:hypothetical protein